MNVVGPRYRFFNYADGGDGASASPMMFGLSHLYNRPDYAVWLRTFLEKEGRYSGGREAVFHVLWYNPKGTDKDFAKTPLAKKFSGIQDICMMRTAWNDPNAAYLGFKGGYNKANHGHLDIGSFVYEVNGIRWAVDLGADNYNLPGFWGQQRWDYFRQNNRSHNTLVIGDQIQNPAADCKIVEFGLGTNVIDDADRDRRIWMNFERKYSVAYADVDMTDAYKGQVQLAKRFATLYRNGSAIIEDRLEGVTEPVRWGMMTQATIELIEDGKTAILSQGGKRIRLILVSNHAAKFEIVPATPPTEAENQNKGYNMLTIVSIPQLESGQLSIRVVMRPE
jgi:hypothetical protein